MRAPRFTLPTLVTAVALAAGPLTLAAPASAATDPAPKATEAAVDRAAGADVAERGRALTRLAAKTGDDFYTAPATLPERNGALIAHEPSVMYLDPVRLIKLPAQATRIMYRSTGARGRAIAVTGTVLLPTTAWKGAGSRPLVAWSPGTQGMADRCAPSRTLSAGMEYEALILQSLLNAGYAVAVTDDEGLGLPGEHSYVMRESQGHTLLDVARAATQLGLPGVDAASPVGLAGYSEGGGAAGSAAELASTYAPELPIKGSFVGAPPADLKKVAATIDSTVYAVFELYTITGLTTASDLDPATLLNAKGRAALADANGTCVADGLLRHALTDSAKLTTSGKKLKDAINESPWSEVVDEQKLGMAGRHPVAPVLVADSISDDVIPFAVGKGLARRWCAQSSQVQFQPLVSPLHIGGGLGSVPHILGFFKSRFAGAAPIDSCSRL